MHTHTLKLNAHIFDNNKKEMTTEYWCCKQTEDYTEKFPQANQCITYTYI